MSFIKKGTVSSTIVTSSSVYTCNKCDHVEVVRGDIEDGNKKCPKCEGEMQLISASTGDDEDIEESSSLTEES
ncbi:hypothetical protein D4R86_01125 [bacterium]|nr:MAG: hypothetical protein D4R86_01125 [bacterium]